MKYFSDGIWGGWIVPLGLLLRLFAVITAQPGFLSISCGGTKNHTAENNITWVPDVAYIDVELSRSIDIGDASVMGSYLNSLRSFPNPLNKSCYHLPLDPDFPYLLRLWFVLGNYKGFGNYTRNGNGNFNFTIEALDILTVQNVNIYEYTSDQPYYENIFYTSATGLYICLVRTSSTDDPFISAIELRRLQPPMYNYYISFHLPISVMWILQGRYDVGGNSVVRYPQDKFDRIWTPLESLYPSRKNVSLKEAISTTNTRELPPPALMQTAQVTTPQTDPFSLLSSTGIGSELGLLYFAELETLNMTESRSFLVRIDGQDILSITLMRNRSALEVPLRLYSASNFELIRTLNSTRDPIINAYECLGLLDIDTPTYWEDSHALNAMNARFHIKDWMSDPCYFIPWNGIGCDNITQPTRISEIDLSGRNFSGSVPNEMSQLTALVNLSLHNNNFMGAMPNLTNLTILKRLYLQNNNFNGNLEWLFKLENLTELYLQNNKFNGTLEGLSKLKNLQEVNIENNNFNGVLLVNCSWKFNYAGNRDLVINNSHCNRHRSNKINRRAVIGITVSGILIMSLIVGIVVKFRKKEEGVATERRRTIKEPKSFLYQDYSMIMVPNPTKSRAFTLHEMIVATQNFSQEIGRGGFGSVFLGKLAEGQLIAVKVLSLFSRQGIEEFLNEVDLLSKINHRNLVSLLGYCSETKEVMLIYEHMSGGSLRDHLHGPIAENSELNWKRRLKIALDAAQGLEYLHVGCTPKIIHRDIKTANILLDSNFNGKLSDFGLSRMTIDGEATHVTTAVKGTFGYLDPEYYNTQMLTEKSDVYSFGVVLLEMICGRPPIDIKLPEEKVNIVRWVTPYLVEMDEIIEIIDKRMCGGYDINSIIRVAKVAMRCVQPVPTSRPSVGEVVAELKEAIKHEYKDSISTAEDIGIQNGDLEASLADSNKREGMEWSDNSSNTPRVGR